MLVISAGGVRSGSTWMTKCLWEILKAGGYDLRRHQVIKIHRPEDESPEIINSADYIFYCYRDMRDAIASGLKYDWCNGDVTYCTKIYMATCEHWEKKAALSLKYEHMMGSPSWAARQIGSVLNLESVVTDELVTKVNDSTCGEKEDHRSYGGGHHYMQYLTKEQIEIIESLGGEWLVNRGYLLGG